VADIFGIPRAEQDKILNDPQNKGKGFTIKLGKNSRYELIPITDEEFPPHKNKANKDKKHKNKDKKL
jgi:hypothetical protein